MPRGTTKTKLLANRIADDADRLDAGELLLPGDPEYHDTLRGHR